MGYTVDIVYSQYYLCMLGLGLLYCRRHLQVYCLLSCGLLCVRLLRRVLVCTIFFLFDGLFFGAGFARGGVLLCGVWILLGAFQFLRCEEKRLV